MEFREVLRRRRRELDLTLEEVGLRVGVTKGTVHRWESGMITNIQQDKIAALAAVLQVSPEYLLGWTEDPNIVYNANVAQALADLSLEELQLVLNYVSFIKSQRHRGGK